MKTSHLPKPMLREQRMTEVTTMPSLVEMEATVDQHSTKLADHDARLRALEKAHDNLSSKIDKLIFLVILIMAEVPITVIL